MHDNVCLLKPATIEQISHLIVAAGHRLQPEAEHIERISSRKGPRYQERLQVEYRKLLKLSGKVTRRASQLLQQAKAHKALAASAAVEELGVFLARTEQVCDTARRRVLKGKTVPNSEKLFSMFEPHTQLYKRGKAGEPVQFGRLVLVFEDARPSASHRCEANSREPLR